MRLGALAGNLLERLMLGLGLIPTPFLETHAAMILSRTVAAASRAGIFDALADGPASAAEVAQRCDTVPGPTAKLLDGLTGAGYLRHRDGSYRLRPVARRWLLRSSSRSLHDQMQWQLTEWQWLGELDRFLFDGVPVDMHSRLTPGEWDAYQRGMRALARILAPEVALRTPVPRNAQTMLDIGGSHGLYSVALCRRHPQLRSVVFDLPQALTTSSGLLAEEGLGDRVIQQTGNILDHDLGVEAWDVVFMSQLAHHFDEDQNRRLTAKIARSLRPGGVFVLQDLLRPQDAGEQGQLVALYDLYFSLTSAAGTWRAREMAGWQRAAGLRPSRPVRFVSAPGMGQQAAFKDSH